jgi:hypothetical protein
MHRSGTSAMAGLLIRLGGAAPKTLMAPYSDNPTGFWESAAFFDFHEALLRSAGTSWDAWTRFDPGFFDSAAGLRFEGEFHRLLQLEFGTSPLIVVKDPRMCRLVPFWLRNLERAGIEPIVVLTIRDPTEVAGSLSVRNHLTRENSLLIWLRHVLDAEAETREVKRSVVRYDDLLKDWMRVAARIAADTGLDWPTKPDRAASEVADFLRPELRHHAGSAENIGLAMPLCTWVTKTCRAFDLLVEQNPQRQLEAAEMLDNVRRELDSASSLFAEPLEKERKELRERVESLEDDRGKLNEQLSSLQVDLTERRAHVHRIEAELSRFSEYATALNAEKELLQRRGAELEERGRRYRDEIATLQVERDRTRMEVEAIQQRADKFEHRICDLERELAAAKHHVDALLGSLSWRLMAPLRVVARVFMRQR